VNTLSAALRSTLRRARRLLLGRRALSARHPGGRGRWGVEAGLVLVGLGCLGFVGAAWAEARWVQTFDSRRLAAAEVAARGASAADGAAASAPSTRPARRRVAPGELLGRIDIPRIDVSSVILEGASGKVLRNSVGHIRGTALPGEAGNVALAGHRDSFFSGLREIERGDRITVTTPESTVVYRVDSTEVVAPTDVSLLEPTRDTTLTLVTCYPFHWIGPAPRRFVVRARAVAGEAARPAADAGSSLSGARAPTVLPD
jgi:sortase A